MWTIIVYNSRQRLSRGKREFVYDHEVEVLRTFVG